MYLIDESHHIRAYHRMTMTDTAMDKELILDHIQRLVKERV